MSPQQVRGEADRVDGRSDIFSLGVILYQLATGRSPYRSRDVQSLKREILENRAAPLRQYCPEAPIELEQICQRAMAKEPDDRFSSAKDFARELRHLLEPNAGTVSIGSVATENQPSALQVRSSMYHWWTGALTALLGGVIAVGWLSLARRTESLRTESNAI